MGSVEAAEVSLRVGLLKSEEDGRKTHELMGIAVPEVYLDRLYCGCQVSAEEVEEYRTRMATQHIAFERVVERSTDCKSPRVKPCTPPSSAS